jgi:hypothetical protein
MARAEVIDITKLSGDTVKFGATVTVIDGGGGYTLLDGPFAVGITGAFDGGLVTQPLREENGEVIIHPGPGPGFSLDESAVQHAHPTEPLSGASSPAFHLEAYCQ